jgi:hypothetical protein
MFGADRSGDKLVRIPYHRVGHPPIFHRSCGRRNPTEGAITNPRIAVLVLTHGIRDRSALARIIR